MHALHDTHAAPGAGQPAADGMLCAPPAVEGLPVVASRPRRARAGELPHQYYVICRRGGGSARPYVVWTTGYQGGTWIAWNGRYDMTLQRARQVLDERADGITSPHCDQTRLARAALTWLTEPGDPALSVLLDVCQPEDVLDAIRTGQLPGQCHALSTSRHAQVDRALNQWRLRLPDLPGSKAITGMCRASGIRLICPEDPEWPSQLDELADTRPCALWVKGAAGLAAATAQSVTVVDIRTCAVRGPSDTVMDTMASRPRGQAGRPRPGRLQPLLGRQLDPAAEIPCLGPRRRSHRTSTASRSPPPQQVDRVRPQRRFRPPRRQQVPQETDTGSTISPPGPTTW
jgi:hypothetical protein